VVADIVFLGVFVAAALAVAQSEAPPRPDIPLEGRVTDEAKILSPADRARLEALSADLELTTCHQMVFVTAKDLRGETIELRRQQRLASQVPPRRGDPRAGTPGRGGQGRDGDAVGRSDGDRVGPVDVLHLGQGRRGEEEGERERQGNGATRHGGVSSRISTEPSPHGSASLREPATATASVAAGDGMTRPHARCVPPAMCNSRA